MSKSEKICVVIVTYNRLNYLKKLLERLYQIELVHSVYVFDNYSSDETLPYFQELFNTILETKIEHCTNIKGKAVFYYRNNVNSGGSGGFHSVVELAMKYKFDYLWIMDDDVLPDIDCLQNLRKAIDSEHKVCIPDRSDENFTDTAVVDYSLSNPFKFTPAQRIKRVPCCTLENEYTDVQAMAFEGPLIDTDIVKKIGFPDSSYFILFDDSDYCRRILSHTKVRLVKGAVLHKQIIPTDDNKLSWKDYYSYRNCFIYDKKYGTNLLVKKLRPFLIKSFCVIHEKRRGKIAADIVRIAYKDAVNNKTGKTMQPGKIEEYLYNDK